MKHLIFLICSMTLLLQPAAGQGTYKTAKGYVSFYSKAPISNVDARNGKAKVRLNTSTGNLTIDMAMSDFEFRNEKMEKDATDKYLETKKYSKAGFRGKIITDIDYKKPGAYPATAKGKLTLHGTTKEITEKGTVIVQDETIKLEAEFNVLLKDYRIETPRILGQEMTDDKVLVKFEATLAQESDDKRHSRK